MKKGIKYMAFGLIACVLCSVAIMCTACVPTGEWMVTLEYDDTRGRVDLNPYEEDMIYFENTVITVTVTPNPDCKVEKVYLNGATQTLKNNKFQFTITENTKIQVIFIKKDEEAVTHQVGVECDETKGSIELSPAENGNSYYEGMTVTATVKAKDGFKVSRITVDGKEVTMDANGKFEIKMDGDRSIVVEFVEA